MKEYATYKDKCRVLDEENTRLKVELDKVSQEANRLRLLAQNNTQGQANVNAINQYEVRVQGMQEEIMKSQTMNAELTNYIKKL